MGIDEVLQHVVTYLSKKGIVSNVSCQKWVPNIQSASSFLHLNSLRSVTRTFFFNALWNFWIFIMFRNLENYSTWWLYITYSFDNIYFLWHFFRWKMIMWVVFFCCFFPLARMYYHLKKEALYVVELKEMLCECLVKISGFSIRFEI